MPARIDALQAKARLDAGVRFVDVLPASVYEQEHLPGAVNVPLVTFAPSQLDAFDRAEPMVVYCFDQH